MILIISLHFFTRDYLDYKECNNYNNELIQDVITKEDEKDEIKIDWEQLENSNSDIIGWIEIKNTNINYPILKDTDSLKYLKHSYNGLYNSNGSIFTLNNNPFYDKVTTIYGHNMKSDIMFSELEKYLDYNFFNNHSTFEIYTKECNYKATVFSCYSIGVNTEENNIKKLNFDEEVEYYKKMSKYSVNNIGKIEKIVKLSTCSYLNSHTIPTDQRYYIIAKIEENN